MNERKWNAKGCQILVSKCCSPFNTYSSLLLLLLALLLLMLLLMTVIELLTVLWLWLLLFWSLQYGIVIWNQHWPKIILPKSHFHCFFSDKVISIEIVIEISWNLNFSAGLPFQPPETDFVHLHVAKWRETLNSFNEVFAQNLSFPFSMFFMSKIVFGCTIPSRGRL